jgi:hypothetical protein
MRGHVGILGLVLACLGAAPSLGAQTRLIGRLEGGTLNANDPFNSTLAFGAAAGITEHSSSFLLHVVRQSWNRNSGSDVSDGRTFALLDWELAFRPSGAWKRQAFVRLGAGWVFQSPFKSALTADAGAGLRYELTSRLFIVGTVVDQVAWVRTQLFTTCLVTICTTTTVPSQTQHNFGLLVDLEIRP